MLIQKPNVLWIMCDQLRRHSLSCYGDSNVQTPSLDRLAREGVQCELGISSSPVCMPFRASLVTGQYCNEHGVRIHGDLLTSDRRTIAHTFRAAGYRTSYVGKWHLASSVSDQSSGGEHWVHPLMRGGFEDWYGFDVSNNYYNTCYSYGDFCDKNRVEGHQTEGLAEISLSYLQNTALKLKQPWFHVLSFEAPHGGRGNGTQRFPSNPAEHAYEMRFDPNNIILRENVPEIGSMQAKTRLAGYYAMIEQLDFNIGRILDWLDESGLNQHTLVVFFSDHGDMMGSHGRYEKQVAYEESIGIPLILRLPGILPEEKKYGGLFSGIDIYPTCAGLCEVPVPANVQGFNLSADILGLAGISRREVLVQWMGQSRYHWGDFPYRAIRTMRYTYCVASEETNQRNSGHFCLLFDNEKDQFQLNNLYGKPGCEELQKNLHMQLCRAIINSGEEIPGFVYNMHCS
ncbi:MAG TPA: hypothetical protein DCY35_00850 [Prolixibacteraceae bacterium]|nr:hypothetical protein [Prolixibacteraceae bacterium]